MARWCRAGLLAAAFTCLVFGLSFGVFWLLDYEWPTAGLLASILFVYAYSMYRLLGTAKSDKDR